MFELMVAGVRVIFTKFFASSAGTSVCAACEGADAVVFVDTGATPVLVDTIKVLKGLGKEVIVRDHHLGEGRTPFAAAEIVALLNDDARIVERAQAPACVQLIELGEFDGVEGLVIVADPDLDGLTAAMAALGISYGGMDRDAAAFDGPRSEQSADSLTPLGWTVARAMSTLPPYNPKRPQTSLDAKAGLFGDFAAAAGGDEEALERLEARVSVYEAQVKRAKGVLASAVKEVGKGVFVADVRDAGGRHDLATLTRGLEEGGAVVTVEVSTPTGPFAAAGWGVRYSLAVVKRHQEELDLRDLVPEGTETGMEAKLLSNVSFLLHCGEEVWQGLILPALLERLG